MAPSTVRRYRQYGNTEVMEVGTRRCSPFLSFHLQTRKNERAHRLRIIAAHRLVHVVIKRAGAIALPFFGIASQTGNRAGLIDADDSIFNSDEVLDDAFVRATRRSAIRRIDVAESNRLQKCERKHRRGGGLEIVAVASRLVDDLPPHARLRV